MAGNLTSNSINVDDFVLEVDTNTQSQEQTKMGPFAFLKISLLTLTSLYKILSTTEYT